MITSLNPINKQHAAELAERPYSTLIIKDDEDGEAYYLAHCLTLHGCKAHGLSVDATIANIQSARIDYIWSLLDDGLDVPEPGYFNTGQTYLAICLERTP